MFHKAAVGKEPRRFHCGGVFGNEAMNSSEKLP
jgi:hypothetical protein